MSSDLIQALTGRITLNRDVLEIHVVRHPKPNRGWDVVLRLDGGYVDEEDARAYAKFIAESTAESVSGAVCRQIDSSSHVYMIFHP